MKNVGKGLCCKDRLYESYGNVVVFADSDMEIDLKVISEYLDALKYGDIVIASKKHHESK